MSQSTIDRVWEKGTPIRGRNPETWRKDPEGNVIRYGSYGTKGDFGWEIDHKNPRSKGGTDNIRNLQPLQWDENRSKSNTYPY